MSSPSHPPRDATSRAKRTRTRSGCLNCRRKKRKCDESRPRCGMCFRRNESCNWGLKLSFKSEHAQSLSEDHPSMRKGSVGGSTGHVTILDLTREIVRDYDAGEGLGISNNDDDEGQDVEMAQASSTRGAGAHGSSDFVGITPYGDHSCPTNGCSPGYIPFNGQASQGDSPTSTRHTGDAVANLIYLSRGGDQASPPLGTASTDSIGALPVDMLDGYFDPFGPFTPEVGADDGIFLPGSAYHELHSTLRNHLIQEVNSNAPTRSTSPGPMLEDPSVEDDPEPGLISSEEGQPGPIDSAKLTMEEECLLWKNWFDEIAPWLDKFDNARHFQNIIPTMAPQHQHLHYAMLALSARQLERKGALPTDRSLHLYQEAIHHLLPHLPSRSTAVIASCVVLCVLEMLSCSPKAWRRHLDGCASLMEAVGINGFVGGTEQALFWCFARMDVCGALISSVRTLIPVSRWVGGADLEADVSVFLAKDNFADYANYVVYLIAQVIDLLASQSPTATATGWSPRADAKYKARWLRLWKHISEWHASRPPALRSVFTVPSAARSPFPTVLYSNSAAISGNQLYHTASILMLQSRPPSVRQLTAKQQQPPRSILWHARQVCAISMSNEHHGAWTNGIQPLWIAGKCMSHPEEHRAILDLLERIERESGWATRWRADDLKEYWGDPGRMTGLLAAEVAAPCHEPLV